MEKTEFVGVRLTQKEMDMLASIKINMRENGIKSDKSKAVKYSIRKTAENIKKEC